MQMQTKEDLDHWEDTDFISDSQEELLIYEKKFLVPQFLQQQQIKLSMKTQNKQNQDDNKKPVIIIIRDQETTLNQIAVQYLDQRGIDKDKNSVRFYLESDEYVNLSYTIRDFKNNLNNDDLKGLPLYAAVEESKHGLRQQSFSFEEIKEYFQSLFYKKLKNYYLCVNIPQHNQEIYIDLQCQKTFDGLKLKKKISEKVRKVFCVQVQPCNMQISKVKQQSQVKLLDHQRINSKVSSFDKLVLRINDPKVELVSKGNENDECFNVYYQDTEPLSLSYEQLHNQNISYILKKLNVKSLSNYCVQVFDKMLKPSQPFSEVESILSKFKTYSKNISLKVVDERQIFYKKVQSKELKMEEILSKIKVNETHRENVVKEINRRSEEFQRQVHINLKDIKKIIAPIFIYTSQLYLKGEFQKSQENLRFYVGINEYLRTNNFIKTLQKFENNWKYNFSASLVDCLKELKRQTYTDGRVFRGLKHNPKYRIGESLTFKQFLSTSRSQKYVRKFFAKKCLLIINVKKGYEIKKYSSFSMQQQVLLLPFTCFVVTRIQMDKQILVYYLQQRQLTTPLDNVIKNEFMTIWVDQEEKNPKAAFENIELESECYLSHLKKCQQLKNLLEQRKNYLKLSNLMLTIIVTINSLQQFQELQLFIKNNPLLLKLIKLKSTNCRILLFVPKKFELQNITNKNMPAFQIVTDVKTIRMQIIETLMGKKTKVNKTRGKDDCCQIM